MSIINLRESKMEFKEVLRSDRKKQLSWLPILRRIQTEDHSLLAMRSRLVMLLFQNKKDNTT